MTDMRGWGVVKGPPCGWRGWGVQPRSAPSCVFQINVEPWTNGRERFCKKNITLSDATCCPVHTLLAWNWGKQLWCSKWSQIENKKWVWPDAGISGNTGFKTPWWRRRQAGEHTSSSEWYVAQLRKACCKILEKSICTPCPAGNNNFSSFALIKVESVWQKKIWLEAKQKRAK